MVWTRSNLCPKCSVGRMEEMPGFYGLTQVNVDGGKADVNPNMPLLARGCKRCGFTELYNATVMGKVKKAE